MGNLIYLVTALGLAALGTLFLVWRARTPTGMHHNIRNFADQLDSLAPQRRRVVALPSEVSVPAADTVAPIYRSVKLVPAEPDPEPEPEPEPDADSDRARARTVDVDAPGESVIESDPTASIDGEQLNGDPHHRDARPHDVEDVLDPRSFDLPATPRVAITSEADRARLEALHQPSPIDPATLPPLEVLLGRETTVDDPLVLPTSSDAVRATQDNA
jgi:hypothetical protein